ncbi:MAG: hypothetical protein MI892_03155, partial [Desulfobacterales bacterium]|nr:hypothetical protein [Desulfobacterales bacterium]
MTAAVNLLSHGWLDSQIREGALFRHAVWQGKFNPTRAADAAMFMDWLRTALSNDDPLKTRLQQTTQLALAQIPDHHPYTSGVSHVRPPSVSLRYGRLDKLLASVHTNAKIQLNAFTPDGTLTYKPGDTDFSTTHFTNHANGYGGRSLVNILEAATLTRDPQLVRDALALLDQQTTLYSNTVPRGAQTWELALHTPDILASAHLVRCYVYGYILTGRNDYLEQARYWAWTGVPFVYLIDPTPQPIGRYATIAVYGATHWVGSWFGRPVQWCGLVYAHALHLLHDIDPNGPWQHIAHGITASGIQQCWPTTDKERQGLLPDFVYPRPQLLDGPAINPGTTQATVPELFGR